MRCHQASISVLQNLRLPKQQQSGGARFCQNKQEGTTEKQWWQIAGKLKLLGAPQQRPAQPPAFHCGGVGSLIQRNLKEFILRRQWRGPLTLEAAARHESATEVRLTETWELGRAPLRAPVAPRFKNLVSLVTTLGHPTTVGASAGLGGTCSLDQNASKSQSSQHASGMIVRLRAKLFNSATSHKPHLSKHNAPQLAHLSPQESSFHQCTPSEPCGTRKFPPPAASTHGHAANGHSHAV